MGNDCNISTYYLKEEHDFKLNFRSWFPINPRGLMIFIHGAGEDSRRYVDIGTESASRQFAFVAPDLRGFGQSDGQPGHIHRFHTYLDDLDQLIDYFRNQFPNIPLYLIGHSLGALVIIRYVQHFTETIEKLSGVILSSPALGIHTRIPYFFRKCAQLFSRLTPSLSLELVRWNESLKKVRWLHSRLPGWTSELLSAPSTTVTYTPRWITELLRNEARALTEVNQFHVPTLCLYGLQDSVADSKHIELFMKAIPASDKHSIFFDDGGHCPLNEHRKDEVVESIFQWLSSLPNIKKP
ncbi:MAG: alpha/beta fold hydrolase [Bacillota bacterium]